MMRYGATRIVVPLLMLAAQLLSACDDGSPTSPTTPAAVQVTIVPGTALLRVGERVQLSTFVARSDGTGSTQAAAWSSDRPAVAAVEADGLVRGVAAGVATLTAVVAGAQVTRALRVVPDVEGRWLGIFHVLRCDGTPQACAALEDPNPSNRSFSLTLGQTGDVVQGGFRRSSLTIPVTGTVTPSNDLELGGTLEQSDAQGVLWRRTVSAWRSQPSADARSMTGRLQIVDESRQNPTLTVEAEIESLTRLP